MAQVDCYKYCLLDVFALPSDTFIIREVTFTTSSDTLCIKCRFIDGSVGATCHAVLTSHDGGSTFILEIIQSASLPTSSACISELSSSKYQLQVYDIDSNGSVVPEPAFTFEHVSILGSGKTYV